MLEYKTSWYGKDIIKVGRFFASSKTCSNCRWKNEELSLKDRKFVCKSCGIIIDRDYNAALNIKRVGVNVFYNQLLSKCKTDLSADCDEGIKIENVVI